MVVEVEEVVVDDELLEVELVEEVVVVGIC